MVFFLIIVKFRINRTLCTGAVRNALRMNQNQRYEGSPYRHSPYGIPRGMYTENRTYRGAENVFLFFGFTINTQVATFYTHSTPLECRSLNMPFSIDISPLWGRESGPKTSVNRPKFISGKLGYKRELETL